MLAPRGQPESDGPDRQRQTQLGMADRPGAGLGLREAAAGVVLEAGLGLPNGGDVLGLEEREEIAMRLFAHQNGSFCIRHNRP
jgi:hypothetical protein